MGMGGLNSLLGAHGESRTLLNISSDESALAVTCHVICLGGMTEERKMVGVPLHLRTEMPPRVGAHGARKEQGSPTTSSLSEHISIHRCQ